MAETEIEIAASPEVVWSVLSDPYAYASWVVGTKRIRGADAGFPEVGTRFYHSLGIGPITLSDSTSVLKSDPPRLLSLDARMGALGSARVDLELRDHGTGTLVHMTETGARGPSRILAPAGDLLLRGRNVWSLERLKEIAERRA
ncbi:MAG TPA: SRPBCC domain-containing protein [Gaiellaceae bacterium]|nr:SRPBCC domain-containing protein [Gaiellaceae bacterium]